MFAIIFIIFAVFMSQLPIAVKGENDLKCELVSLSVLAYAKLYEFNKDIEDYVSL